MTAPTPAQVQAAAAAIRALWLREDAPTDEEVAAAVLGTVHQRALSLDAIERVRPLIGTQP